MAPPVLARLTIAEAPPRGVALARPRAQLLRAIQQLASRGPAAEPALALTTCGGFFCFSWPRQFGWSDNRQPSAADRCALEQAAGQHLEQLLTPPVRAQLASVCHFLTIGADSYVTGPQGQDYCCELVAVVNLRTDDVRWTGKYFPTNDRQARRLYRCPDVESHLLSLRRRRTLVLGCHDLNLFSPRGMAVATPGGFKDTLRADFLAQVRDFKPALVLHHPHVTQSPQVWRQAMCQLRRELPSVRQFVSGLNINSARPPATRAAIQQATTFGPAITEV